MKLDLCISVHFVQPYPLYHGRGDAGEPEWPPSPMRLFQALLNAASLQVRGRPLPSDVHQTLQYLETLRPHIVAPRATVCAVGYRAYVPHNQADLVSAAWHRGNLDASIASHRMEKDILPIRIERLHEDLPTLHYLYPLSDSSCDAQELLRTIRPLVRAITHLGWGIDQVAGDATLIDSSDLHADGERWSPSTRSGTPLRVHRRGSLRALIGRYGQFLNRLRGGDWTPVAPLSAVDRVHYRRHTDSIGRPYVVFKLLDANDDTYTHPHANLIHVAGMVRHLAIETMTKNPPRGVPEPALWVDRYVAGHRKAELGTDLPHKQLSYVPLPSIGNPHTDPGVRRVMIVAPVGDDEVIEHLGRQLDGRQLKPKHPDNLRGRVFLSRVRRDGVIDSYTSSCRTWASFTPVILPGHDDHKPEKTQKLIQKALAQAGIDQPCEFDWSAFSRFANSYSAHKYVRDEQVKGGRRLVGYIRPDHLLELTGVHLRLTFQHPVPGPLTIGAGRHCGFGLMATDTAESDRRASSASTRTLR
jgi:CRISPR-associated protein Csb2